MPYIYTILALVIPFLVEQLKKFNVIPLRWLPILTPVIGIVSVFAAQMLAGATFQQAILIALSQDGIAVGGGAAVLRQVYVKTVKGQ